MEYKYWKVVLRYGHVGNRKEVSLARHLVYEAKWNTHDIYRTVSKFPGVKHKGVTSIRQISQDEYIEGYRKETEAFYIKNLKKEKQIPMFSIVNV